MEQVIMEQVIIQLQNINNSIDNLVISIYILTVMILVFKW